MSSIQNNTQESRFEIAQNGEIAVADYQLRGEILTVTHILVPPSLRGQGVASDLARAVIAHARPAGLKIHPQCSFMAAFFERHPEEADLRV